MIKKLSQKTSEFIKSQQYIQSTYTIIKELIENSLDAKASIIKVFIDEDFLKVNDNGIGIKDLTDIGNEGCTSKELTTFYVLGLNKNSDNLFCGYRSLALSSIKNMCDLEIISKHETNDIGIKKNITTGEIVPFPREKGTTVSISNIFNNCPIRKKLNKKMITKDIKKILYLIGGYSTIYKTNFIVKYKENVICSKKCSNTIEESCKERFKNFYNESLIKDNMNYYFFMLPCTISKEESFIFCDKRLVTSKNIFKAIKNTFNLFSEGNPVFILKLKSICDFNISPTKTDVIIDNEEKIINFLKNDITEFFSNQMVFKVEEKSFCNNRKIHYKKENFSPIYNDNKKFKSLIKNNLSSPKLIIDDNLEQNTQNLLDNFINEKNQRQHIENDQNIIKTIDDNFINEKNQRQHIENDQNIIKTIDDNFINEKNQRQLIENDQNIIKTIDDNLENDQDINKTIDDNLENDTQNLLDNFINEKNQRQHIDSELEIIEDKMVNDFLETPKSSTLKHIFRNSSIKKLFNIPKILNDKDFQVENTIVKSIDDSSLENTSIVLEETIYDFINPIPKQEITLVIQKNDFYDMEIIGQFNKGFIVTKLVKNEISYLLVIDQHAADEIYNYENLQLTKKMIKQKLISPFNLKLSSIDLLFIEKNLQLFFDFGFEIKNSKLLTLPVLKNHEFKVEDFYDLLESVKNEENKMSKIHKILASKACRMSTMIGDNLNKGSMEKIVKNLGTLSKPWKCPHGRPTFMIVDKIL